VWLKGIYGARVRITVLLLVLLVCTLASESVEGNKPVVAVFEIKNDARLKRGFLVKMRDVIATELAASGKFSVVPNSDIQKAIREKQAESYEACYDESCQIEIGKEIAAEKTLATSIKKVGSQCIVTLQLYDLRKGASEKAGSARATCGEDFVVDSIYRALSQLTRKTRTSRQAVTQGDEMIGDSPVNGAKDRLNPFHSSTT